MTRMFWIHSKRFIQTQIDLPDWTMQLNMSSTVLQLRHQLKPTIDIASAIIKSGSTWYVRYDSGMLLTRELQYFVDHLNGEPIKKTVRGR